MAEVQLTVGAAPAVDAERIERLTGQLRGDLRDVTGLQVRRKDAAEVPEGARAGAALQLGTLVVSGLFSATEMPNSGLSTPRYEVEPKPPSLRTKAASSVSG